MQKSFNSVEYKVEFIVCIVKFKTQTKTQNKNTVIILRSIREDSMRVNDVFIP